MSKGALSAGRPSHNAPSRAATLASLAERAPTKRVNFDLSVEQHTKLKVYAARQGKTVKDLLTEMVERLPE